MFELSALSDAFGLVLQIDVLAILFLGVLLGIIVGAIPGIGSSVGMALLIPFTFSMPGLNAILLLIGIYSGSCYSASIPAILINTPGSGNSAAAVFEGYPLSQKGRANEAISAAAVSSFLGGNLGIIVLIIVAPMILPYILLFGTPEFFLVAVFGMALITIAARGAVLKGLIAGAFGLLLSTIGSAPLHGVNRYNFDLLILYDGLDFIAIILGIFAIAEMFKLSKQEGSIIDSNSKLSGSILKGVRESISRPIVVLKSGLIGISIGAIPGAGSLFSTFVAYIEAMRTTDSPESFGEGNMDGVVAVDAANNGTISGALLPTLVFGIPGSGSTAVLLGAIIMHGIRPGPQMLGEQIPFMYAILIGLFLGNFLILFAGIALISKTAYLTQIDTDILIPIIIILAICGSFILRNNFVDPIVVFFMGLIGYYMKMYNYSIIALLLGVILGPLIEQNFIRSLQLSNGSYDIFVSTPLAAVLTSLIVITVFGPLMKNLLANYVTD